MHAHTHCNTITQIHKSIDTSLNGSVQIYTYIQMPTCLSQSVYLHTYIPDYTSLHTYPSTYTAVYLYTYLPILVYLPPYPGLHTYTYTGLPTYLSTYLGTSVCLPIHILLFLPTYLPKAVYLPTYLYLPTYCCFSILAGVNSMAVPAAPSGSILILVMILDTIGLPSRLVGVLFTVDWILYVLQPPACLVYHCLTPH